MSIFVIFSFNCNFAKKIFLTCFAKFVDQSICGKNFFGLNLFLVNQNLGLLHLLNIEL